MGIRRALGFLRKPPFGAAFWAALGGLTLASGAAYSAPLVEAAAAAAVAGEIQGQASSASPVQAIQQAEGALAKAQHAQQARDEAASQILQPREPSAAGLPGPSDSSMNEPAAAGPPGAPDSSMNEPAAAGPPGAPDSSMNEPAAAGPPGAPDNSMDEPPAGYQPGRPGARGPASLSGGDAEDSESLAEEEEALPEPMRRKTARRRIDYKRKVHILYKNECEPDDKSCHRAPVFTNMESIVYEYDIKRGIFAQASGGAGHAQTGKRAPASARAPKK